MPTSSFGAATNAIRHTLGVAVVGLSLGGLRRRIEALLLPDDPVITLNLDRTARRERATREAPRRGLSIARYALENTSFFRLAPAHQQTVS
jgi:hypothetical protein